MVNGFEWIEDASLFNEDFVKSYNEESDRGYFFEADVQYPEKLHDLHNDLPFLLGIMKIKKVEKLANLHDKTECYSHKKLKSNIKPWANVKKGTQNDLM